MCNGAADRETMRRGGGDRRLPAPGAHLLSPHVSVFLFFLKADNAESLSPEPKEAAY